ncbi:MAG: hypothetical protein KY397_03300, partial [Gemmatimonadetes bacterium]|nr:hypothetical protein [Gemmatimonadota bacterium]
MGIRGVEGPSLWFSLIGVLVFVSSGCSEPTASENRARLSTATFRLVRFDGRPLPVDEGPV